MTLPYRIVPKQEYLVLISYLSKSQYSALGDPALLRHRRWRSLELSIFVSVFGHSFREGDKLRAAGQLESFWLVVVVTGCLHPELACTVGSPAGPG